MNEQTGERMDSIPLTCHKLSTVYQNISNSIRENSYVKKEYNYFAINKVENISQNTLPRIRTRWLLICIYIRL